MIFGAGHDAEPLRGLLRELFAKAGLEDASGLDVLVLAAPAGAVPDPKLVNAISAVLSSTPVAGPLAGLPWTDESGLARLRDTAAAAIAA